MPTQWPAGAKPRRPDCDQRIGNAQQPGIKVVLAHSDPLIAAGLETLLRKRRDLEVFVSRRALTSNATAGHLPPAHVVVADYDSGLRLLASADAGSPRVMILTHSA